MGQQKGNPTPSYQNQAYETLYPNTNARLNRDMGTKPVMIDDTLTLKDVVDVDFETDLMATMVSQSVESTMNTKANSSTLNAFSSSQLDVNLGISTATGSLNGITNGLMAVTASMKAATIFSGSIQIGATLTNYANDTAAQAGGVPIGGLYHTSGTVKVRLV